MNQLAAIEPKYYGKPVIGQRRNGKFTAYRLAVIEGYGAKPMYVCDDAGEDRLFDTRQEAVKAAKAVFA